MNSKICKLFLFINALSGYYLNSQTIMNIYENNGVVSQIPIGSIDSVNYSLSTPSTMFVYQQNGVILQFTLNTIDSVTYTINNPGLLASISTSPISSITSSTAISGGNIANDGGSLITHRGVVLNINPGPTTANTVVNSGLGLGNFASNIVGLIPNTTYFVRSYATNSAGTAYGNEISFTTNQAAAITSNPGSGVNFGGYFYPSIILGNGQEWMTENLKTSVFANGQILANLQDVNQWSMAGFDSTAAWVNWNNDPIYDGSLGKLYNWYAVLDNRNVCPNGWHVPSALEWDQLIAYLDPNYLSYNVSWTSLIAGEKLKSTVGWDINGGLNGIDLIGFSAKDAGSCTGFQDFNGVNSTIFWTSTNTNQMTVTPVGVELNGFGHDLDIVTPDATQGASIRCLKN
jgi:uncharacterized protein (TIGR02145 family)